MSAIAGSSPPRVGPLRSAAVGLGLVRDLGGTLLALERRYGPVVDVGHGPARIVLAFGAEANEALLSDQAAHLAWGPAMWPLEVVDGPTALVLSDGDDHRRRRRLVQPAFSVRRVEAKAALIAEEIDRVLDAWTPGRRLVAHDELRAGVRRIAVRSLFGDDLGERADAVGDVLEPALRHLQRFPRVDVDLPFTGYGRALRGRRAADEIVRAEIARRRAAAGPDGPGGAGGAGDGHDVLSALLAGADDDVLSDDEVLDQVRSLIAAGYDTTAGAAAYVVHELGNHPDVLAAVRAEVAGVVGDRPPTVDDLRRLPTVDGVVREVLRLWPPGFVAGREVVESFDLLGHRIPAGRRVMYSAYVTGRLPTLWDEPDRFDPSRWAPGAPEVGPYAFVPFGGGGRRCIGFALATLELQVLVVRLAQRVRWTLERPVTRPVGVATAVPAGGVPIVVSPLV